VLAPELAGGHYTGPCLHGLAHGEGTVELPGTAQATYRGAFEHGQRTGTGLMRYPNGDTYVGQWQLDQRTGEGQYTYGAASPWAGDRYEGQWLDNRFHGQGRYTWSTGDSYQGPWLAGQQAGPATPSQIRRQAHMTALEEQLPGTDHRVCPVGAPTPAHGPARVTAMLGDRLQLQIHPEASPTWHLAALWRPCTGERSPH
jgi:hypothetical protein